MDDNTIILFVFGYVLANALSFLVWVYAQSSTSEWDHHYWRDMDTESMETIIVICLIFIPMYIIHKAIPASLMSVNNIAGGIKMSRSLNQTIQAMEADIRLGKPVEVSLENIHFLRQRLRSLDTTRGNRKEKQKILLIIYYAENYGRGTEK